MNGICRSVGCGGSRALTGRGCDFVRACASRHSSRSCPLARLVRAGQLLVTGKTHLLFATAGQNDRLRSEAPWPCSAEKPRSPTPPARPTGTASTAAATGKPTRPLPDRALPTPLGPPPDLHATTNPGGTEPQGHHPLPQTTRRPRDLLRPHPRRRPGSNTPVSLARWAYGFGRPSMGSAGLTRAAAVPISRVASLWGILTTSWQGAVSPRCHPTRRLTSVGASSQAVGGRARLNR